MRRAVNFVRDHMDEIVLWFPEIWLLRIAYLVPWAVTTSVFAYLVSPESEASGQLSFLMPSVVFAFSILSASLYAYLQSSQHEYVLRLKFPETQPAYVLILLFGWQILLISLAPLTYLYLWVKHDVVIYGGILLCFEVAILAWLSRMSDELAHFSLFLGIVLIALSMAGIMGKLVGGSYSSLFGAIGSAGFLWLSISAIVVLACLGLWGYAEEAKTRKARWGSYAMACAVAAVPILMMVLVEAIEAPRWSKVVAIVAVSVLIASVSEKVLRRYQALPNV